MIRAADPAKLVFGALLELLNRVFGRPEHEIILAEDCFGAVKS